MYRFCNDIRINVLLFFGCEIFESLDGMVWIEVEPCAKSAAVCAGCGDGGGAAGAGPAAAALAGGGGGEPGGERAGE